VASFLFRASRVILEPAKCPLPFSRLARYSRTSQVLSHPWSIWVLNAIEESDISLLAMQRPCALRRSLCAYAASWPPCVCASVSVLSEVPFGPPSMQMRAALLYLLSFKFMFNWPLATGCHWPLLQQSLPKREHGGLPPLRPLCDAPSLLALQFSGAWPLQSWWG